VQYFAYDDAARLNLITNSANSGGTFIVYGSYYKLTYTSINNPYESYHFDIYDGLGRENFRGSVHPGSSGGYQTTWTRYDLMGRVNWGIESHRS
jgi:hypothetical protein